MLLNDDEFFNFSHDQFDKSANQNEVYCGDLVFNITQNTHQVLTLSAIENFRCCSNSC